MWELSRSWTGIESYLGDQLRRAADSIGANLVEGYGRAGSNSSKRDYPKTRMQFYGYSIGSTYEALFWLERGIARRLIEAKVGAKLLSELSLYLIELEQLE